MAYRNPLDKKLYQRNWRKQHPDYWKTPERRAYSKIKNHEYYLKYKKEKENEKIKTPTEN